MNYYAQELRKIKKTCFSNESQLNSALKAKKYIDENFKDYIDLKRLAKLNFMSKFHLIRIFKRYFGVTPRQYLINKRIEAAQKVLIEGRSVSDTCYSVGFGSVHSFSNLFKSKTGITPSAYRSAIFDKWSSQ